MSTGEFGMYVPMFLVGIVYAFGAAWIAPKMGDRRWLWVLFCLIPGVNIFVLFILPLRVAGAILDRLNVLGEQRKLAAVFV